MRSGWISMAVPLAFAATVGPAAPALGTEDAPASAATIAVSQEPIPHLAPAALEDSLARAAVAHAEAGEYLRARTDYEALARLLEARLDPDDSDLELRLARIYNNIGRTCLFVGEIPAARAALQKAIEIRSRLLAPDHADLIQAKSFLGDAYHMEGDYAAALALYEECLATLRRGGPSSGRQVGMLLTTIGALQHRLEDYAAAEAASREALAIVQSDSLCGPGDVAMVLSNLAAIRAYVGGPAEGRAMAEQALELYKLALPPGHPTYAVTMSVAAFAAAEDGDYSAARSLWRDAIAGQEQATGPDSPDVGHTLLDYGNLLLSLGEIEEAQAVFVRARKIFEAMQGPQGPTVIDAVQGQAQVARARHDPALERALLEEALAAAEAAETPREFSIAGIVAALSEISILEGDVETARPLLERSLAVGERHLGPHHHQLAPLRQTLARLDLATARVAGAREELDALLAEETERFGPDARRIASIQADRARALWETGAADDAFAAAVEAERVGRKHLRLSVRGLPERPALSYAMKRPSGLDLAIEMALQRPSLARSVWNELLRSRSLVLDEMAARHRALERDPESARLRSEYQRVTSELAQLTVRADTHLQPLLASARLRCDALEESLAARSLTFRAERAAEVVDLSDVAAQLDNETALIGIARFHKRLLASPFDPSPPEAYVAFVLSGREADPAIVDLGPCEEIDAAIAAWRRSLLTKDGDQRARGQEARARVWDPMMRALGQSWSGAAAERTLYLVPDGALFLVDWYALPDPGDRYLVEMGPEIVSLTTERDLLEETGGTKGGLLLALGGVAFDEAPDLLAAPTHARMVPASAVAGHAIGKSGGDAAAVLAPAEPFRGATWSCPSFDRVRFAPLPGSHREIEEIAKGWPGPVRKLTGTAASEGAFKELAPGASVLHLATHGFAFSGECAPDPAPADARDGRAKEERAADGERGMGGLGSPVAARPAANAIENPLRLAGLALAGANARDRAALGAGEDGILTAEEIASLDLSTVQLAVLAACDTGIGTIARGEGVLGLRRAFRHAGTKSLLLSLWPVEDESARRWMVKFHQAWRSGRSVSQAARATSREILAERRAAGAATPPTTWAGFVATGARK